MILAPPELEEERRPFYVALTRAQKAVVLSYAMTRMRNGKHESNPPSRFLREIDRQYLANPLQVREAVAPQEPVFSGFGSRFRPGGTPSIPKPSIPKPPAPKPVVPKPSVRVPDKDFIPMSVLEMEEGMRIEHNRFGKGVIIALSGDSTNRTAIVLFDEFGEKKLLLNYAKIRRAE